VNQKNLTKFEVPIKPWTMLFSFRVFWCWFF